MGRKNKTYRLSLHQQVYNRLTDMQAFGESKQLAKTDGTMKEKIFSYSTIFFMDKRRIIKESASVLFRKRGFRDVNVAEIMRIAGFATGTFYLYFTSKEVLFYEVYQDENDRIGRDVISALDQDSKPREFIATFLHQSHKAIKRNHILNIWQDEDLLSEIRKACRVGDIEGISFVSSFMNELFARFRAEGLLKRPVTKNQIDNLCDVLFMIENSIQDGYGDSVSIIIDALGEYFVANPR